MASEFDDIEITLDAFLPDDDLDGSDGEVEVQYLYAMPIDEQKVLPVVRGNRCMCPNWVAYQNELLKAGKYSYEELYPLDALCLFDAWDQAHEQDRIFDAARRATNHPTTKEGK